MCVCVHTIFTIRRPVSLAHSMFAFRLVSSSSALFHVLLVWRHTLNLSLSLVLYSADHRRVFRSPLLVRNAGPTTMPFPSIVLPNLEWYVYYYIYIYMICDSDITLYMWRSINNLCLVSLSISLSLLLWALFYYPCSFYNTEQWKIGV